MKSLVHAVTTLIFYTAASFAQTDGEIKIPLTAPNAKSYFGKAVDISGRRAIIAAVNAAHIYENDGIDWRWRATLRENEKVPGLYGYSVAIDGDYAVVGGEQAYVYRYDGQSWKQSAALHETEKNTHVALSGAWAIAGGGKEIAFYQRAGETWQEKANFDPDGHSTGAKVGEVGLKILFGKKARLNPSKTSHEFNAVAISGPHAIAGVPFDSDKIVKSGAVYFYALEDGDWKKTKRLKPPDPVQQGYFGSTVDISGDYAIIGAEGNVAAYIYKRDGQEWRLQKTLKVGDADRKDRFGNAVAINGDFAVVGAQDDNGRQREGGAVYVFRRTGEDWIEQDKLYSRDLAAEDRLGITVALSGPSLLAGASFKHATAVNAGAAYAFDLVEKTHAAALANFLGLAQPSNRPLANEQFRFAANAGRPLAAMWLAVFHARGECNFPKDEAAAKTFAAPTLAETQRLVANGSVEAQYLLAEAILNGASENRDTARALALLKSAAQAEYLPAARRLAFMHLQGEVVPRDDLEALGWLEFAAEKKAGAVAMEAVNWLKNAVENGDLSRSAILGNIYAEGLIVEKNTAAAFEYCRRGAQANYAEAMHGLGSFYHAGIHVEKNLDQANEWYRKAAAKGYAPSMRNLGKLNDEKSNYLEAASWFEKGALAGDVESMSLLGAYYARGTTGAPNSQKALQWYRKAADQGDAKAMMSLGNMYLEGAANTPANSSKAIESLSKAAATGYGPAHTRLGKMYFNGEGVPRNFTKALEHFERAGRQNDPEAYVMIGKMYYSGKGAERNMDMASRMFEYAIKSGYDAPPGVIAYGMLKKMQQTTVSNNANFIGNALGAALSLATGNLREGIQQGMRAKAKHETAKNNPVSPLRPLRLQKQQLAGVEVAQNPAASLSGLRSAAAQKNPVALNNLGVLYWNGQGVEPDMIEAVELIVQAAALGNLEATTNLGLLYYDAGSVDAKNYSKAIPLLSEAAKAKHDEAMSLLGDCHFNGHGVPRNYEQALTWYSEAAKLGNAEAMKNIGYMYVSGTGVDRNYDEAYRWYKGAADRGNTKAMYNLAVMYLKGTGVEKSYRTSASWAKRAASLGDEDAEELLYCDNCGNTGRSTCDQCGGRGQVAREGELSYLTWSCSNCSGTGKVQCNVIHLTDY